MDSAPAHAAPRLKGVEVIKDNLKRLPAKAGVYRMFGVDEEVLYVGKARNLKNRVSNYAKLGGHTQRIALMISLTARMEFVVTETETEALLLEANLIKSLKPRFNILLRDDKSFPYILIARDTDVPRIVKHRGAKTVKGDYFGPFASAGAVKRTLDTLQKAFLVGACHEQYDGNRGRPCIYYGMKRCAGLCFGKVTVDEYSALVDQATDFLRGKSGTLQDQLASEMESASDNLEFEKAARLRDRIRALAHIRASQDINPDGLEEADIFATALEGGQSCVQVFFIRAGQNWGTMAYYPRHERDATAEEILAAFIVQFYDDRPAPRHILTSHHPDQAELIAEALELRADHKVDIRAPQRGSKRELVMQASRNAEEALARKLAESASQQRLLKEVEKTFDLPETPKRIEVYDNSHIQGSNAVGGMIVAGADGFMKNQYRKFNIKDESIEPGDDYAMMREVMRRRFSRLLKEAEEAGKPFKDIETYPDLVLIDGGLGQLSVVLETLRKLELGPEDVTLVSIAKGPDRNAGREKFFRPAKAPFQLPQNSPVLYYLQRLRDEAHRWAIGAHRSKRSAAIRKNPLDEIAGIGPNRKKALLHRFGSARGVARAKLADIASVDGINQALAERIYGHFNGG
ncbi:MAG: excinuclease ABC subunit UvrC [Pseudomonadota bacterium]